MDDTLDLRAHMLTVLRAWRLILLLTVLAAVAAAAYAWTLPSTYEAAALISVTQGRITLALEGVQQGSPVPARAFVELAQSGSVLRAVQARAAAELPGGGPVSERMVVTPVQDSALLRLRVTGRDAGRAAALANLWAAVFAEATGQLYAQDRANLALFEQVLAGAEADLAAANTALTEFEADNTLSLTQALLASRLAALDEDLARAREADQLTQSVGELLVRLEGLPAGAAANLADDLALVSLAAQVYGGEGGAPVTVQLGGGQALAHATVAEQRRLAEDLLASLEARQGRLAERAVEARPAILHLQGEVAGLQIEAQRLTQAREAAATRYETLAARVRSANVALQQTTAAVQVVGPATTPAALPGVSRAAYALLGAAAGAMLGAGLALARAALQPGAGEARGQ